MRKRFFTFSMMASTGLLLFGAFGLTACNQDTAEFQAARVTLNKSKLNLAVGDKEQLRVSISPKSYRNAELRWFTSNENVAYVNENGYVFGVGEGTSTVTASVAGGYAKCEVTVSGEGGGETNPYLILSTTSKSVAVGGSFELTARVYPENTTVTYNVTSGADKISVSPNGNSATVEALGEGNAVITAVGNNGKSAVCNVTITSSGGGGGEETYDMGVLPTERYSATIKIGASEGQSALINSLVAKFNQYTGSSITANVIDFNESKAADLIANDPTSAPHLYPFASDQTLRLYNQNIIQELSQTSATSGMEWIEQYMGETALDYATLPGANKVVGYPFASDNGYVLFYNKNLCSAEDVETVDSLFAKAKSLGYEIDYDLANGAFYNAGAFMSYNNGKSLFDVTVKNTGYNATGHFDSEAGLKGARALFKVFKHGPVGAAEVPSSTSEVMATIVDCSNVKKMKEGMGSGYAVAPLPFIDEEKTTRLGVYLGYKLYGINPKRANTPALLSACDALARFFTSEYAQVQRFNQFYIKPTCTSLDDMCKDEPHIKALNQQLSDHGIIPLTVVTSKLWDQSSIAAKAIQTLTKNSGEPTDAQLKSILGDLDDNVTE